MDIVGAAQPIIEHIATNFTAGSLATEVLTTSTLNAGQKALGKSSKAIRQVWS